MMARGQPQP